MSASSSQRCAVPRCGTVQSESGSSSRSASQSSGGNGTTTRRAAILRRHVVARQERAQHGRILLLLESLEEAVLAADHASPAHAHQHADGVVAVARVADDVRVAGADDLDADRLLQLLEPAQRVAQSLARSKSSRRSRPAWPRAPSCRTSPVRPSRKSTTSSTIRR